MLEYPSSTKQKLGIHIEDIPLKKGANFSVDSSMNYITVSISKSATQITNAQRSHINGINSQTIHLLGSAVRAGNTF